MNKTPYILFTLSLISLCAIRCSHTPQYDGPGTRQTEIHGHRGSRGTHPENTLAAFKEALDAGAEYLEFDLLLSKDGIPIVFHDDAVTSKLCKHESRQMTKPILVSQLTVRELKEFDCGSVSQKEFPHQKLIPGTTIPTLEETLVWLNEKKANVTLNAELKVPETDAPDAENYAKNVIDTLKKHNWLEKSLIQSFEFSTLRAVKKIDPSVRLSYLTWKDNAFCETAKRENAKIVSPNYDSVTDESIALCLSEGIEVVPYTANDESEWERLMGLGVKGIITDYPRALKAYLSNHQS